MSSAGRGSIASRPSLPPTFTASHRRTRTPGAVSGSFHAVHGEQAGIPGPVTLTPACCLTRPTEPRGSHTRSVVPRPEARAVPGPTRPYCTRSIIHQQLTQDYHFLRKNSSERHRERIAVCWPQSTFYICQTKPLCLCCTRCKVFSHYTFHLIFFTTR